MRAYVCQKKGMAALPVHGEVGVPTVRIVENRIKIQKPYECREYIREAHMHWSAAPRRAAPSIQPSPSGSWRAGGRRQTSEGRRPRPRPCPCPCQCQPQEEQPSLPITGRLHACPPLSCSTSSSSYSSASSAGGDEIQDRYQSKALDAVRPVPPSRVDPTYLWRSPLHRQACHPPYPCARLLAPRHCA